MEVLRIISLGNGWILDTFPLGGSFNLHDEMRVASNLDQLKDEVAMWATRSIEVPADAVPDEEEKELNVPIDEIPEVELKPYSSRDQEEIDMRRRANRFLQNRNPKVVDDEL